MNTVEVRNARSRRVVRLKYIPWLVLVLSLMCAGCGQSSYQAAPPPSSTLATMQGSWELVFHSQVSPNVYKVFEANLLQAGTHVFAGTTGSLVYQGAPFGTSVSLSQFGGQCDAGPLGNVTVDATLSNQGPSSETVSLIFNETGALGSVVTTASASTDGMSISNGTYSIPAACGLPADHGTFSGYRDSVSFGADVYSGSLNGGADVIVARITSTPNSFDLTVAGTDNGAQFSLTGSTVGFSVSLAGTVVGNAVNWFGIYDPLYNTFRIYDSSAHFVGNLHSGANP